MKIHKPIGSSGAKGVDNIFRGIGRTDVSGLIIYEIIIYIIGLSALPLRLLLRRNIGERSISLLSFISMYSLLLICFFTYYFYGLPSLITHGDTLRVLNFFQILFLIINPIILLLFLLLRQGYYHYKNILKRAKSFSYIHSYYRGDRKEYFGKYLNKNILGFTVDDDFIRMIIEPYFVFVRAVLTILLCLVFSFLLELLPPNYSNPLKLVIFNIGGLSIILLYSSIFLFIEEYIYFIRYRAIVLDILDSEMDLKMVKEIKIKYQKNIENGINDDVNNTNSADDEMDF